VPLLILLSSACLIAGLVLPVITLKELVFWKHTFSVLSGIQALWREGDWGLAVIIFLFSIIFPFIKLVMLLIVWYKKFEEKARQRLIYFIGQIGKWSMLDVFVISITIVITKTAKLIKAEPRPGIYIFGLSVLLAMAVTMWVERLAKTRDASVLES
jgi:paraquat-inducible protein A